MPVRRDKPAPPMSLDTYRLLMLSERMEEKPHRCGRCANGTGVLNPECPNRRKQEAKGQER
jgi:hypothetical protein